MAGYRDIQEGAKLRQIVKDFVEAQQIFGPECVYQSDRVIENAYEFIQELCDVAGYHLSPDENGE